jgi:inner membrane protein
VSSWTLISLVAFSLLVTLATRWIAARLGHSAAIPANPLAVIIGELGWMLLIFATGVIAARYLERFNSVIVGYLTYGCAACLLSLIRAFLYQRAQQEKTPGRDWRLQNLLGNLVHSLTHLLFAAIVYLTSSLLIEGPANPILLIAVCLGSLLPDLDSQDSPLARLLPFVGRQLETRLGPGQEWHTLGANAFVAAVSAPLIPLIGLHAWLLISIGFLSHLVLDMIQPEGVMLFWPFSRARYRILRGFVESLGNAAELKLATALAAITISLFFVAAVGPPPAPPVVAPTFESTFEHYLSLRGRNLVFADVDGTWQATGRRISARFEILNVVNQSFIMLDRYDGRVFTAGRTSAENLYLNTIRVVVGQPIQVKPVEIQLHDQPLARALPIVYQMQREPGLQHIFVQGQVIVSAGQDVGEIEPPLHLGYTQTQLPKIQSSDGGHFTLQYLSASDLIGLANTPAEIANLVIVATYVTPAAGPTATPLPSPPPIPREAP